MALLDSFRAVIRQKPTEKRTSSPVADTADEKHQNTTENAAVNEVRDGSPPPDRPGDDLQRGVQQVEAVTLAWSKATLIAVFFK